MAKRMVVGVLLVAGLLVAGAGQASAPNAYTNVRIETNAAGMVVITFDPRLTFGLNRSGKRVIVATTHGAALVGDLDVSLSVTKRAGQ